MDYTILWKLGKDQQLHFIIINNIYQTYADSLFSEVGIKLIVHPRQIESYGKRVESITMNMY